METKKFIAIACLQPEIRKVPFKVTRPCHETLTYKVTRQGYSVGLCCIEFPDPKNHENKKKFIAVACLQPEIGMVPFKVT